MTIPLLLAASLLLGPGQDTTVALSRGDRVVLDDLSGEVRVRVWDRNEMRVRGEDGDESFEIRRAAGAVRLLPATRRGKSKSEDLEIFVPAWVDLEIGGRSLDVDVVGTEGQVRISNVRGDIAVSGSRGSLDLRTIQGEITVRDAVGSVTASSGSDDIYLSNVTGSVALQSNSGDLTLLDVAGPRIRADTQAGDVEFSGSFEPDGVYGFFVHSGDVVLALPEGTSALVTASTFNGDFESDFPVRLKQFRGGQKFEFQLGAGEARLEIQVFDGEIQLVRRRGG